LRYFLRKIKRSSWKYEFFDLIERLALAMNGIIAKNNQIDSIAIIKQKAPLNHPI
jgi:hypothetical protein